MNDRVVQLVLIGLLGVVLGWLLMGRDGPEAETPLAAAARPATTPAKAASVDEPRRAATPPKVTFRLPKMPAARAGAVAAPRKRDDTIEFPREWELRGSASKNYELRSDKAIAFTGNYSASLISHDKDVSPNLSGSGIQAVLAAPYIGTRVELSAVMRGEEMRNGGSIWMYATDPSRVIVAYQVAQMSPTADAGQWTHYHVVMDIPYHAEVLAYGFTLQGKGRLWVDDVHLSIVDNAIPVTGPRNAYQLGVIAQAVSVDGALARPANLDFEDVVISRERQAPPPRDQINGTRF